MKNRIGIKYCGGCNPRYDRVKFTARLKELMAQSDFEPVAEQVLYDCVVVVCGCHVACASLKGIRSRRGFVVIREDNLDEAIRQLERLCESTVPSQSLFV